MKPAAFRYAAPKTVEEVTALLREHGADARILAGGQSLVPLLNLRIIRPSLLIDLNRCANLTHIETRGSHIAIGSMVRQIDAIKSSLVQSDCPLIAQALSYAGPVAVRSRATVGGTLAHADRVAELPAVAMALDAILIVDGVHGRREVAVADFFLGDLTTAIEPGEFLREVLFPVCERDSFSSFAEVSVRQEGVAIVGLAAYLRREGGRIAKAALAAMGVDAAPVRLTKAERALERSSSTAAIDDIAKLASEEVAPMSDAYAAAEYRKHVIASMVKKALRSALAGVAA